MGSGATLSRDEVFFLLSSRRRRFVLRYLRRTGEAVDRATLVDALAAWENGVDAEDLTEGQRRTVDVSLYQTHLEELGDAGVVDYDPDTGRVAPTDRIEEFAGYLDRWREAGTDDVWDAELGGAVRGGEPDGAPATADAGARRAAADEATDDDGTRALRPRHYLALALASLAAYLAVVVDSGVIWRVPLLVAAAVVFGLVAVHVYPLYSLRRRGPFRAR